MWGKTVLVLRISAAVWAGLIGMGVILQIAEIVPALPKLEPWAWGVSLAIIAVDNVGTLFVRKKRTERERRARKIESVLQTALRQLVSTRELRLEDLGANVYLAANWKRMRPEREKNVVLERVGRYRPIDYPQQSGVHWTDKKGVVGECWRRRGSTSKNWYAVAQRYGGVELTEQAFFKIPADTRCGFTHREFVTIVGKYSEVVAEPIWHPTKDGVLIGVLTIDRAYQSEGDTFRELLSKRSTHQTAGLASLALAAILKTQAEEAE
ncbi:hypothetical protein A9Z40_03270 [Microbacterium arborescens]|uniref:GAF domain-containing protein n=1 Tax=Microbacterium arborescens TaxID=33883 RepID=A0ABX2WID9_9MICO|nr:hypothetical protein [Microbacterium arborescens]OAZ40976.1 hypothetical protein A9Z40_03270 [Microbacterium arborescens]